MPIAYILTGLYKWETEIRWRKDDNKIKKQTDIDRHGPKPSSNSSQPPDPPDFSLPTTFKENSFGVWNDNMGVAYVPRQ